MKSLLAKVDSAESFKALILSPTTESLLLKMNWKVRGELARLRSHSGWTVASSAMRRQPGGSRPVPVPPSRPPLFAVPYVDAVPDQAPRSRVRRRDSRSLRLVAGSPAEREEALALALDVSCAGGERSGVARGERTAQAAGAETSL